MKNVVFMMNVDLGREGRFASSRSNPYKYSVDSLKRWCDKNDCELFVLTEEVIDHDRAYKLLDNYLSNHPNYNEIKKFWKDHTAAIKRFHRYPHRNKVMGRKSTPDELKFLESQNSSW